ncbi:hypothetical protein IPG36_02075 [bacterium]|nr:MAG: hypothetical protein IPG36_02075 [bacterium]
MPPVSTGFKLQLDEKQSYTKGLTAKLDNKAYVQNAPEAVVAETRDRLINTRQQSRASLGETTQSTPKLGDKYFRT